MRAPVASSAARDLVGVATETAFRGNEFAAAAGAAACVADRPTAAAFEVIGVYPSGHAQKHEVGTNGGGADEQIATGKVLIPFIMLVRVHRENSGELRDD